MSAESGAAREIPAGRRIVGRLRVPPSKSATHRAYNLALLANRRLTIRGPLRAEDTELFQEALRRCGWRLETGAAEVRLEPGPAPKRADIFCGNAGTLLRFLTASLTTRRGEYRLDGTPRLRERPLGPLIAALRALGAGIRCAEREGHAPLVIEGGSLRGGEASLDAGESSQYLSALLMAGHRAAQPVTVTVPRLVSAPYVDLTIQALAAFGGRVERAGDAWRVVPAPLGASAFEVEGDYSAACYPAAAAALTGGEVVLEGLNPRSAQADRGFFEVLGKMGARVRLLEKSLLVAGGPLRAVDCDLSDMPDQVPTLAALAPFASGTTRIRNVRHLRLKESDRLRAMAEELSALGAAVTELEDGLVIPGVWAERSPPVTPVTVNSHGDHRIAMSLAVAGLRRPGVAIAAPDVVAKSYPEFWADFARLGAG